MVAKRIVLDRDETPRGERESGAVLWPHLTGLLRGTVLRWGLTPVSETRHATQSGKARSHTGAGETPWLRPTNNRRVVGCVPSPALTLAYEILGRAGALHPMRCRASLKRDPPMSPFDSALLGILRCTRVAMGKS